MNRRRTSPGFFQWLFIAFIVAITLPLLFQLYQYGTERRLFPVGLEVAGVDVGGLTRTEAESLLTEFYLEKTIVVRHGENPIDIRPQRAEFTLDFDTMMTEAIRQRDEQDYWAGFWGYVWGRPIDVEAVQIQASHNRVALRETLELLSQQFDIEPRQPQASASSMSFQTGAIGLKTDIDASIEDIERALYRPNNREVTLILETADFDQPDLSLLRSLLTNTIQQFENSGGGRSSVYVINLTTGEEVGHNEDLPMTGLPVFRIAIMVEALRTFNTAPTPELLSLLREVAIENDNRAVDELLIWISGDEDDALAGTAIVTESMRSLGLRNTFIGCPFTYEEAYKFKCAEVETDAFTNAADDPTLEPDPYYQTTAKDMGLLLSMVYDCAVRDGGTLLAMYSEDFSAEKCTLILDILKENQIGSLIEEGVPPGYPIAHRHGWQTDTNGDAGIIFSPEADYVIAQYTHKPNWLAWEVSSPLMADLSRATYNFFNYDDQWYGQR